MGRLSVQMPRAYEREILEVSSTSSWLSTGQVMQADNVYNQHVELFLEKGADVSAKTMRGYTPLHIAAKTHNPAAVTALVARGANCNSLDSTNSTPLHHASARRSLSISLVEGLIGAPPISSPVFRQALRMMLPPLFRGTTACDDALEALVRNEQASLSGFPLRPILAVMQIYGVQDVIPALLQGCNAAQIAGADIPNGYERTPLAIAVEDSNHYAVGQLLEAGHACTQQKDELAPFHRAVATGDEALVALFIKHCESLPEDLLQAWTCMGRRIQRHLSEDSCCDAGKSFRQSFDCKY